METSVAVDTTSQFLDQHGGQTLATDLLLDTQVVHLYIVTLPSFLYIHHIDGLSTNTDGLRGTGDETHQLVGLLDADTDVVLLLVTRRTQSPADSESLYETYHLRQSTE